jgi:hypothetical protein
MAETAVLEEEQVQAAETPETQEVQEEQEPQRDEFLDVLYTDLGVDIAPPPAEEESKEEGKEEGEPQPEPEPEKAEPEPEEKAEEKPRKKRFNIKQPELSKDEIRQTIREELKQQSPAPPLPPPATLDTEEEDDLEDYLPEQREEIELARYAESLDPKKYKGMERELVDFYNNLDAYIDKSDDEDRTFDENDEAFMEWVANNKPTVSRVEQRKLERQMIKDQALTEARSEFDGKNKELEEKIRQVSDRPKAEKELTRYENLLSEEIPEEGDELAEAIYENEMSDAKRVGEEYLELFYGLKTYDEGNTLHSWIIDFVTQQSEAFSKHGGEYLSKTIDGIKKSFVPPSEYGNVDTNKHWTFTSSDIMDIMGNYFQTRAKDSVKSEEERLNKMGFTRQSVKKSQAKAKKDEPKATVSPKATPSSSPGTATTDGVQEEPSPGEDILDRLGINYSQDSLT